MEYAHFGGSGWGICDNYATHKHPKVTEWLSAHPRFHMHFTPTSASWLNMVERFFRDITVNRLRNGVFRNIPELTAAIKDYIAAQKSQAFRMDRQGQ